MASAAPAAAAKAIACPACGGSIEIKAAGYTITLICQYCGSVLDVANPDVKVIAEYHEAAKRPAIPLGSRGSFDGVTWEAIGYLERTDGESEWSEYLLFNPYAGYRWLVDADGEWSFGRALTATPATFGSFGAEYGGVKFDRPFDPYGVTTDYVLGEFYWRVRAGDQVAAQTFERGDRTLSVEASGDEVNWTLLTPLPAAAVESAFGLAGADATEASSDIATDSFVGQSAGKWTGLTAMFKLAGIAFVTLIVLTILFGMRGSSASQEFTVQTERPAQTIVIGTITISRPYQAISIDARGSDFVNKWVDLDYELVNRETQQAINAYGLIEYYTGTDSDGSWSEGSRSTTTKIAQVPRGTYDITVEAAAKNWQGGGGGFFGSDTTSTGPSEAIQLRVSIAPGGAFWSNLFLFLILLLIPPLFILYRRVKSGQRRVFDD